MPHLQPTEYFVFINLFATLVDSTAGMASEHGSRAHSSNREPKRKRDRLIDLFKPNRSTVATSKEPQISKSEQPSKVLVSIGLVVQPLIFFRIIPNLHRQSRQRLARFHSTARIQVEHNASPRRRTKAITKQHPMEMAVSHSICGCVHTRLWRIRNRV